MKLIIDISEETYECVKEGIWYDRGEVRRAIRNGTPIPDNSTNGDVIKALFPTADISLNDSCVDYTVVNRYGFDQTWWDSPYQKGEQ